MRVFINGRFLSQRVTGVQRYAHEMILALDAALAAEGPAQGDLELTLLAPPGTRELPLKRIGFESGGRVSGNVWEQTWLPWMSRDGLLLSFGPTGPLLRRWQVVTMHDAIVYAVPEAFSWKFRAWYRVVLPVLARRAPCVVTVSEFSKRELARYLRVASERFRVVGGGWQHVARTRANAAVLERNGLVARRYLLAVSSLSAHKNFAVIARALSKLEDPKIDVVVAGAVDRAVFGRTDPTQLGKLKLVGHVDDEELRALYENAAAFIFPSRYEGFGLPPLEAMALGCPVIASNAAAIPEVCGSAALYFDPDDAETLALLMQRVLGSSAERARLVELGNAQLTKHGWELSARLYLRVLRALHESRN